MGLKRRILNLVAGRSMLVATLFSGLLVVVMGVVLYLKARPLFVFGRLGEIIFGENWSPSMGHFGMKAFITGTFWVTGLATILAVPICILAAVYLAEYAAPRTRAAVKPVIDLLAGIPSIVYGLWGYFVVVPFIEKTIAPYAVAHLPKIPLLAGADYNTGFCVLAAGIVLAIMIIPVIVSVSDEVLRAVSRDMREASFALGATRLETVTRVVLKRALPGLVAAVVMGISRALGETMAVLMVAGSMARVPHSIFDGAKPLPALIALDYGEMMSNPTYESALLGAALMLLIIVVFFNVVGKSVLLRTIREGR